MHRFIGIITLLFLLLACSKEKENPITLPAQTGSVTFRVETTSLSKAALDGLSIHFEEGDLMAIWDGKALRKFEAKNSSEGLVFIGEAVSTDTYWAFYPWSEDCLQMPVTGTPVFNASIPRVQNAREGSFATASNIGIGKGGCDRVIYMRNVCGILKFSLPSADVPALAPGSLTQMTLTSSAGVKLSGDFKVSLDINANPVILSSPKAEGDESVSISFDRECPKAGGEYYYSVMPCDLSGGIRIECARSADSAIGIKTGGVNKNVVPMNTVLDLKTIVPDWTPSDGEEVDDMSADPTGSLDYAALGQSSHPRLLLCDEDFRRLRAYLTDGSYPELTRMHNRVVAYADGLIGKSIPTLNEIVSEYPTFNVQKNRHLEELARPVLARLFACAYAYRTTGTVKYLEECRRVLDQVCRDEDWYPKSFLSTAEIAMGVSIAYDWLYYDLTKQERTNIRKSLCSKAISALPEGQLGNENNTGQVYNAGLLAAALVCYEKVKTFSSSFIEQSVSLVPKIVSSIYAPKGSYFEGYSYWNYGTNFQCLYNEMLLTAFGTDKGLYDDSGFRNSGDYRLFMADELAAFSYADGGRTRVMPSPAMWFYAAHYQQPYLLFNELRLGSSDSDNRMTPMIPCALAKYAKLDTEIAERPVQDVWVDSNDAVAPVIMVRKGWSGRDSDVYLGLKGGSAKVNHGHMDAGSFVYHANGVVWSTDVQQKSYSVYTDAGLEGRGQKDGTWKALVYSSLGHSTISFANYAEGFLESWLSAEKIHPTDHIVDGKATIIDSWTTGDELGGQMDLTPLFDYQAESVKRKAVILNDGSLKVEDEIKASSSTDSKLIWRMVTPANVTVSDNSIILSRGGKTMVMTTSCTRGIVNDLQLHNWGTFAQSRPTGGTWGWKETPTWDEVHSGYYVTGFTLTIPKGTTIVMTTLMKEASSDGSANVGFENISAGEDFKW